MNRIAVKPGDVFLLETANMLPEAAQRQLSIEWAKVFPANPIVAVQAGTLSLMSRNDQN